MADTQEVSPATLIDQLASVDPGRPTKLTSEQAALAQRMTANGETAATICKTLGIGRTTLYRYLAESAEDVSISRQPSP